MTTRNTFCTDFLKWQLTYPLQYRRFIRIFVIKEVVYFDSPVGDIIVGQYIIWGQKARASHGNASKSEQTLDDGQSS